MISEISKNLLFLSLALLTAGIAGGYAMVLKIVGSDPASNFLIVGTSIAFAIFFLQLMVFVCMKQRLFYQLIFLAMLALSLGWFIFSIFTPILWVRLLNLEVKLSILAVLMISSACNFAKAFKKFYQRWDEVPKNIRVKKLGRTGSAIDWDKLIYYMRLESSFYIPGIPDWMAKIVSIVMLLLMALGLNLRNAFPTFSAFSVGVPAALLVSFFFQAIGLHIAQACKVKLLEAEYGTVLRQKI